MTRVRSASRSHACSAADRASRMRSARASGADCASAALVHAALSAQNSSNGFVERLRRVRLEARGARVLFVFEERADARSPIRVEACFLAEAIDDVNRRVRRENARELAKPCATIEVAR